MKAKFPSGKLLWRDFDDVSLSQLVLTTRAGWRQQRPDNVPTRKHCCTHFHLGSIDDDVSFRWRNIPLVTAHKKWAPKPNTKRETFRSDINFLRLAYANTTRPREWGKVFTRRVEANWMEESIRTNVDSSHRIITKKRSLAAAQCKSNPEKRVFAGVSARKMLINFLWTHSRASVLLLWLPTSRSLLALTFRSPFISTSSPGEQEREPRKNFMPPTPTSNKKKKQWKFT